MGVSKNNGTPKSSILIGFSIINHPFWGFSPYFWIHPYILGVSPSNLWSFGFFGLFFCWMCWCTDENLSLCIMVLQVFMYTIKHLPFFGGSWMFLAVIFSFWIGGLVGVIRFRLWSHLFWKKTQNQAQKHKQVKVYTDCISSVKHHLFFWMKMERS